MNALLILIPVGVLFLLAAVAIFFWAIREDQFEDLDTPSIVPLLDVEADPSASGEPLSRQPKEVPK